MILPAASCDGSQTANLPNPLQRLHNLYHDLMHIFRKHVFIPTVTAMAEMCSTLAPDPEEADICLDTISCPNSSFSTMLLTGICFPVWAQPTRLKSACRCPALENAQRALHTLVSSPVGVLDWDGLCSFVRGQIGSEATWTGLPSLLGHARSQHHVASAWRDQTLLTMITSWSAFVPTSQGQQGRSPLWRQVSCLWDWMGGARAFWRISEAVVPCAPWVREAGLGTGQTTLPLHSTPQDKAFLLSRCKSHARTDTGSCVIFPHESRGNNKGNAPENKQQPFIPAQARRTAWRALSRGWKAGRGLGRL